MRLDRARKFILLICLFHAGSGDMLTLPPIISMCEAETAGDTAAVSNTSNASQNVTPIKDYPDASITACDLSVTDKLDKETVEVIKGSNLRGKLSVGTLNFWEPVRNPQETGVYEWIEEKNSCFLKINLAKIPEQRALNLVRALTAEEFATIRKANKVILTVRYLYEQSAESQKCAAVLKVRCFSADWKNVTKPIAINLIRQRDEDLFAAARLAAEEFTVPEWCAGIDLQLWGARQDAILLFEDISLCAELRKATLTFPLGRIIKSGDKRTWFQLRFADAYMGSSCQFLLKNFKNKIIAKTAWQALSTLSPQLILPTEKGPYCLEWVVLDGDKNEQVLCKEWVYLWEEK